MPRYGDEGPEATRIVEEQRARLVRFRSAIVPSQYEAAEDAGVSKDVWHRMENGKNRVNPVALARFGNKHQVSVEYVLSGRLAGLPEHLIRSLAAAEREAADPQRVALSAGNGARASSPPSGTSRGKSSRGRRMTPA